MMLVSVESCYQNSMKQQVNEELVKDLGFDRKNLSALDKEQDSAAVALRRALAGFD